VSCIKSGAKAEHVSRPVISRDQVLLLNYVHPLCNTMRPALIRLHGVYITLFYYSVYSSWKQWVSDHST